MTGIYAVLVPDPTWGPRQFQPLFFGVFSSQHPRQLSTEEYTACLRVAAGKCLYIATYNMPPVYDPSESHRIQRELVHVYNPLCNRDRDSGDAHSAELTRKLEALEKKNQEHEVLLKVVLAAIGHLVQPPQEIKKRAVGFQPDTTTNRQSAPQRSIGFRDTTTNRQSAPQRSMLEDSYCN
jgi:hypothetical protein